MHRNSYSWRAGWLSALGALSLLIGLLAAPGAQAQAELRPGAPAELRAGPPGRRTRVAPPGPALRPAGAAPASATFIVTYTGFSAEAQAAFQAAVDIWSGQISSPVPIRVSATWTALGAGVLGSARARSVFRNFAGAPLAGTWYPSAVANKLAGVDLDPAAVDIEASFSSAFPNWYFGTDGNTPAQEYDLETVVLHELGHGLGFTGSAAYSGGSGSWGAGSGFPFGYDRLVVDGGGQALIDTGLFANPSAALGSLLTSGDLFFDGPNAVAAAGGRPKLYAPLGWQSGSSYAHLDESTYPAGSPNSLMTPQLGQGEAILNPGPITLGLLKDIGWDSAGAPTSTPTNTPTNTPVSTPTNTPVSTPTNTPVSTPTNTPVSTPTNTPVSTPNSTPKPPFQEFMPIVASYT